GDERHVSAEILPHPLAERGELRREQRTRVGARRIDEGDGDDLAPQVGQGEPPAVGGRQRECGRRPDRGQPCVTPRLVREGRYRHRENERDGESRDRPWHDAYQPLSSFFSSLRKPQSWPGASVF